MPVPPRGVTRCAASPARNARPTRNRSASSTRRMERTDALDVRVEVDDPPPRGSTPRGVLGSKSGICSTSSDGARAVHPAVVAAGREEQTRRARRRRRRTARTGGRRAAPTAARGTRPARRCARRPTRASRRRASAASRCARRRRRRGIERARDGCDRLRPATSHPHRRGVVDGDELRCRARPRTAGQRCRRAAAAPPRASPVAPCPGADGLITAACSRLG